MARGLGYRKTCEGCGCMFVADKKTRRFHSCQCFATWRVQQPEQVEALSNGARKAAKKNRATIEARVMARLVGRLPANATLYDAYQLGRADAYKTNWKQAQLTGRRSGVAEGFSLAIGEGGKPRKKSA